MNSFGKTLTSTDCDDDDRLLGIEDKKGTLRPGAHADLVVLDRQGVPLSTWVKGKEAWQVPT